MIGLIAEMRSRCEGTAAHFEAAAVPNLALTRPALQIHEVLTCKLHLPVCKCR